jgi:hypothetical protein
VAILRAKRRLLLRQHTSQTKQSVCYTAQRATMRVTTLAKGGIAGFALRLSLTLAIFPGKRRSVESHVLHNSAVECDTVDGGCKPWVVTNLDWIGVPASETVGQNIL